MKIGVEKQIWSTKDDFYPLENRYTFHPTPYWVNLSSNK